MRIEKVGHDSVIFVGDDKTLFDNINRVLRLMKRKQVWSNPEIAVMVQDIDCFTIADQKCFLLFMLNVMLFRKLMIV